MMSDRNASADASNGGRGGGNGVPPPILTFGEALLTYRPYRDASSSSSQLPPTPSGSQLGPGTVPVLEAVGGSELNVACALSLGTHTKSTFVSIVPDTPLGDRVRSVAEACGVTVTDRPISNDTGTPYSTEDQIAEATRGTDLGMLHVVKKSDGTSAPHYVRDKSTFCTVVDGSTFDWPALLQGRSYLVVSGITPLLGRGPYEAWRAAIHAAAAAKAVKGTRIGGSTTTRVVLDLNYRPALGPFEELWAKVEPELEHIHLLVISEGDLSRLMKLYSSEEEKERANKRQRKEETAAASVPPHPEFEVEASAIEDRLRALRARLKVPIVAMCLKRVVTEAERVAIMGGGTNRIGSPMIRRCSIVACTHFTVTSAHSPVLHTPLEALGGGDAWLAGFLSSILNAPKWTDASGWCNTVRRADTLAALSQNTYGDQSGVTYEELLKYEKGRTHENDIRLSDGCNRAEYIISSEGTPVNQAGADERGISSPMILGLPSVGLRDEYVSAMRDVELALEKSRVLPILAPPDGEEMASVAVSAVRAVVSGSGHSHLGPCIEVVLRSQGALSSLSSIVQSCPDIIVGAGTVLTIEQARQVKSAGAKFIVSPGIDESLVRWCLQNDMPIIPGVATASEVMTAHRLGLRCVKFFPAEALGGIPMLKALIAPFRSLDLRWVPTGGINSTNLTSYLSLDEVLCCGGTWMFPKDVVVAGNTGELRRLAETIMAQLPSLERGDDPQ